MLATYIIHLVFWFNLKFGQFGMYNTHKVFNYILTYFSKTFLCQDLFRSDLITCIKTTFKTNWPLYIVEVLTNYSSCMLFTTTSPKHTIFIWKKIRVLLEYLKILKLLKRIGKYVLFFKMTMQINKIFYFIILISQLL